MVTVLTWILGSVIIVSLLSLLGVLTLVFQPKLIKKWMLYMVSFAAGSMLAAAFLDLIPEALSHDGTGVMGWVLFGMVLFLFGETMLYWYHCHDMSCKVHPGTHTSRKHHHKLPVAYLNLAGDAVHNFFDGVIIAGAYMASIPLGIVASIAVIFHEIPQEIGDFGVLLFAGFSRYKALLWNFLCALTAVIGAVATYYFAATVEGLAQVLLPIAAGGFIYIAAADLVPEMHKQEDLRKAALSLLWFVIGVGIMWAVSSYLHV